jgi:tRNA-specific 2-thiouridylase
VSDGAPGTPVWAEAPIQPGTHRRQRVVVAMSGGVDSAVAALLLQRQGYEVVGVTMQVWPRDEGDRSCCGLSALEDARRVAWKLEIPHYVLDFREEFEDRVIGYFCREYLAGRTPNPCIACNRYIKFETLQGRALGLGADYLATGHYARIVRGDDGKFLLCMGVDRSKDQTYVLYQATQQQLQRTLFPLGDYHKREVRQIALQAGLPVAEKAESQEICFISDRGYADFVAERTGSMGTGSMGSEGLIRYTDGDVLGRHRGIWRYTIGQRRGLGLAAAPGARQGHGAGERSPLYVTRIDPETNTVWVGTEQELYGSSLIAGDVNYISGTPLGPQAVRAKIRYKAPQVEATAAADGRDRLRVDFQAPQKAITPGQAVVLYDGDVVLGGGTILQVVE